MVITQEAPSVERVITKEDVLKLIPKSKINKGDYLFYQEYLDREYVLGTIGDRGGGKSGSDAVISIVDFMLRGKTVWSNMKIKCDILVDDETARANGLNSGGVAHYESVLIEKDALLKLDETYRDGCLVIEEINVQFSNVRRFMSNTNIDFNEVCQQLRKFKASMIYNVIDEMFIDSQLRALTDVFIRTYDTAFDRDAMMRHKKPGLDFCWQVYHMTGYLNGEQGRYAVTHKAEKAYFKFAPWHGVYDSMQHQEKGVYSLNKRERAATLKAQLSIESSEEVMEAQEKWGWLEEKALLIKRDCIEKDIELLEGWKLSNIIGCPLTREIKEALQMYGIRYDRFSQAYKVNILGIDTIETDSRAAAHNSYNIYNRDYSLS